MTNIQPTQEQKELAEGILNSLTAPGSVKNNMNLITVTRLIATHEAKQREVLRRVNDFLTLAEASSGVGTMWLNVKSAQKELNTLLK